MSNPKLTIILPVINEIRSLNETIEIIRLENNKYIKQILFVCDKYKTSKKSLENCQKYINKDPDIYEMIFQVSPNVGGAFKDCIDYIKCEYTIIMSSDLETDPYTVKDLINVSIQNPNSIISTSRWHTKKNFKGYGPIKKILNLIFQKFFSILFKTKLTDLTYGYRLYPTSILKKYKWSMTNHSFFLEIILRPLVDNIDVKEVDTMWSKRIEGISNNKFSFYFSYFVVAFKIYFKRNE